MDSTGIVRRRDDDLGDDTTSGIIKRQRGIGGGRGAGYSAPEVSFFLSLLETHVPVANKEWKAVVSLHNAQFPSLNRTANSLRRKFTALCRSFMGGDESLVVPDVRRAVAIKRRMKNRGDVPDDDEPDSDSAEEAENDNDSLIDSQQQPHQQHRRDSSGEAMAKASAAIAQGSMMAGAPGPPARYYPVTATNQPIDGATMPVAQPNQAQPFNGTGGVSRSQAMYDQLNGLQQPLDETNLLELIKMQLLQTVEDDRRRRAEELERREEEWRHREEERTVRDEYRRRWEEERAQRQEDLRRWEQEREESTRRHNDYMQVILSLLAKK